VRKNYNPQALIDTDEDLSRVIELLHGGHFNRNEPGVLDQIMQSVCSPSDPWFTAADFRGFVNAQQAVEAAFRDTDRWTKMSILNTAASGRFSTDRTIGDYNAEIWKLDPVELNGK
jgi:starch phosphorylase